MRDATTNLAALRDEVAAFVAERDWGQFHHPKDLAIGLSVEASEVLEHFLWRDPEPAEVRDDPDLVEALGDELADVLNYLLMMANVLGLDLTEAFARKMGRNAEKYPADQVRGRSAKYTEYVRGAGQ